ncbi:MAG: hypothetical protein R6X33_04390 [Candidatus Brocadiia bacterium]
MSEKKALNPMAMTAEEAAKTLGIPRDWLEEDLAAGTPTNADGTLNLVQYAAWLNQQLKED